MNLAHRRKKMCEYVRRYRQRHPDRVRAYRKKYYEKNRARLLAKSKLRTAKDRARFRLAYLMYWQLSGLAFAEEKRLRARQYRATDRYQRWRRAYDAENLKRDAETRRNWERRQGPEYKKEKRARLERWLRSQNGRNFSLRRNYRLPSGTHPEVVELFVKFNQLKKELRK